MRMAISHISAKRFGVFTSLDLNFVPGINVFLGANATGKSQLLKLLYALHTSFETDNLAGLDGKLLRVFRPDSLGRLVHRAAGRSKASAEMVLKGDSAISFTLSNLGRFTPVMMRARAAPTARCIFLPSREVLSLFPGFVALYDARELEFDETYYDTRKLLDLPALRGPRAANAASLMQHLGDSLGGGVREADGRFYVSRSEGGVWVDLEASLLSEGLRKVATLVRLIANGSLSDKSVLFWDEPEANMNPRLLRDMVSFLRGVAEQGVQVFVATHDTLLSQRLSLPGELGLKNAVPTKFFSFFRTKKDLVDVEEAATLTELEHNPILEEFKKFRDEQYELTGGDSAA